MGTSEMYRAVEDLPEVLDSMLVDLEYLGRESYIPLFVVRRPDIGLTPELTGLNPDRIKVALSARHVPNDIFSAKLSRKWPTRTPWPTRRACRGSRRLPVGMRHKTRW
ncbi:hypothetical protein [Pseudogulbenkiania ferrooxidans]|uniref:Uncharacterized protein n=1 Tax=Pseudogulbenkiania ferrooxidans 2002 TaxID=279714 RepID=B9Z443_9NEIS|nr:hypothetical protein [Pseudogulbenkiania ferrooxidans]EEG08620.1 hypothetical protein FuraDRAFT_2128 [Pseudogulbenkiania ferrooxidans 2002]